jgi:hypothetical protein
MKKAQSEKHPQGRPKWSKNKPKALKSGAEGSTTTDTPTNANTKDAMPSKSVKTKPQAKL